MLPKLSTRCPFCLCLTTIRRYASPAVSAKQFNRSEKDQPENSKQYDLVGPPNPDSNIRKIIFSVSNHSKDEIELNKEQSNTYEWNNEFWTKHNNKFFVEKRKFIENEDVISGTGKDVSDKLSIFYKEFLDKNHDTYMQYNREWYQRNINLLWISFRTSMNKLFQRTKT